MFWIFSHLSDDSVKEEPAFNPGFCQEPITRNRTNIHLTKAFQTFIERPTIILVNKYAFTTENIAFLC